VTSLYEFDLSLPEKGRRLIGVDEAGRGALAGPVVVAAVILDYNTAIDGINDSKKLSPARREKLFGQITASAVAYQIVEVDAAYIDTHNILQATLHGMREAVIALAGDSDLCLIDGNAQPKQLPCQARTVIHGDSLSACIAAASILAKVHRDRLMVAHDPGFPLYGFARHKGYGTALHLKALEQYGPCPLHRVTFAPVRDLPEPSE
jgi:ribonuclease HII